MVGLGEDDRIKVKTLFFYKIFFFSITLLCTSIGISQEFIRSELPVDLERPWEITVDFKGNLWVSEQNGRVLRINPATSNKEVIFTASDYFGGSPLETSLYCFNPKIGAGTLGLALDPDFSESEKAYIYFVYSYNSGTATDPITKFKIKRLKWDHETETVVDSEDLVLNLSNGYDHQGGRLIAIKQNDKSYLFLSIGDNGISEDNSYDCYPDQNLNPNNFTQDPISMNGKIHRFNSDGSIPEDNPISGNSFYTRGHRNPQGLMYNTELDILYDVEHGDRTDDEINILYKGMNYGWKEVRGYHSDNNHPGESEYLANYIGHPEIEHDSLVEAFYAWCADGVNSDPDNSIWCTVAPSDGIYYCNNGIPQWKNSLLVVTLKDGVGTDREVYQFKLQNNGDLVPSTEDNPNPKRFFGEDQEMNGRLRDIAFSPDGKSIYLINNGGGTSTNIIVYTIDPNSLPNASLDENSCVRINPNPANDIIRIEGVENFEEVTTMQIAGIDGKILMDLPLSNCLVDISALSSGTYTLILNYNTGRCSSKFVKR